jgi:8-oxo-dGTP diphosphatase
MRPDGQTVRIPCVSAILFNLERQVLLQQRDNKPELPYAGYWALFGGRIEDGEQPEIALRRELIEEIELSDIQLRFWKAYERFHPEKQAVVMQYIYIGKITLSVDDIVLHEGQAARYFDEMPLMNIPIAFGFDHLLNEFYKNRNVLMQDFVNG